MKCHDRTSNAQKTQTKPEIRKLYTVRLITSKEATLSGPDDKSHHKALTVRSTFLSGVGQHIQSVKGGSLQANTAVGLETSKRYACYYCCHSFFLLLLLVLCIRGQGLSGLEARKDNAHTAKADCCNGKYTQLGAPSPSVAFDV